MEIREGKGPEPSSEPLAAAEVTILSINHGQKHCVITLLLSPEAGSAGCKTQPLCIWKNQLQRSHSSGVTCWPQLMPQCGL